MLHIKKMTQMSILIKYHSIIITWDAPKCNQFKMYSIYTKQNHIQHMTEYDSANRPHKEGKRWTKQKSGLLEGLIKYYLQSGAVHIPW